MLAGFRSRWMMFFTCEAVTDEGCIHAVVDEAATASRNIEGRAGATRTSE